MYQQLKDLLRKAENQEKRALKRAQQGERGHVVKAPGHGGGAKHAPGAQGQRAAAQAAKDPGRPAAAEGGRTWAEIARQGGGDRTRGPGLKLQLAAWRPGQVLSCQAALASLRDGDEVRGEVVVVDARHEAEELQKLARQHDLQKAVAIVYPAAKAEADDDGERRHLPAVGHDGRTAATACIVRPLNGAVPKLPEVLRTTAKVEGGRLIALRVWIPRQYGTAEEWSARTARPLTAVERTVDREAVRTTYGWTVRRHSERETILEGYVKCDEKAAEKALAQSGRHGIFVDRLLEETGRRAAVKWV